MFDILKQIWIFFLSNQTASALTFFSFLFAIFVWLLSIFQSRKKAKRQDIKQQVIHLSQKKQAENQDKQIQIQQKLLCDTRFSFGIELLGNQNESTRIGGAYHLYSLANEYPDEYLNPVCEIFCAHIRTITNGKNYQENYKEKPSNEIQTIIDLLFKKNKDSNLIFDDCKKKLNNTFLNGIDFGNTTLNNVDFENVRISKVSFSYAKLNNVVFLFAKLNNVQITSTVLNDINFSFTVLNDISFGNAKLNDIYFEYSSLTDVDFKIAKLSNVYFSDISAYDTCPETILRNINFQDATLYNVYFNNDYLILDDSNFRNATLTNVYFNDANLSDVDFENAKLTNVDFSNAGLFGVSFTKTVLSRYGSKVIDRKGCSIELTKPKEENTE